MSQPNPQGQRRHLRVLLLGLAAALALVWWIVNRREGHAPPGAPTSPAGDRLVYVGVDDYERVIRQQRRLGDILVPSDAPAEGAAPKNNPGFVGPEACRECHADHVESCWSTAHFLTSRPAAREAILGSFTPPDNRMATASPDLLFEMRDDAGRLVQAALLGDGRTVAYETPIDIITGSGKNGQTFVSWQGECLYELPVSLFRDVPGWVNSPGYVDGIANFARPIRGRCLDCHATWFEQVGDTPNQFRRDGFVLGVTCERCHGPAREHVNHHRRHPEAAEAMSIINPAALSRERSIELCGTCHSGVGTALRPPFSYRPGEPLDEYLHRQHSASTGPGGVHTADQFARLSRSRCFQSSAEMTCVTCHNPHHNERGRRELFAERCLTCHAPSDCTTATRLGPESHTYCADCHLPVRQDWATAFSVRSQLIAPRVRDHYIKIWPDDARRIEPEISRQTEAHPR